MGKGQHRPSGIAQDQAFQRFRKGEFDVDQMLAEQRESAADGQRNALIAAAVVGVLALVLAIVGSGGVTFMASIAFALLIVAGVLALVRRFT